MRTRGGDELRFTPWRGIVVPGLDGQSLGDLADLGLVVDGDGSRDRRHRMFGQRRVHRGPGRHDQTALTTIESLRRDGTHLSVHVSGCREAVRRAKAPHDLTLMANPAGTFDLAEDR